MVAKRFVILHLAHWDQLLGGAELQLKYLAEYLINNGHEVHHIFLDYRGSHKQTLSLIEHPINYIRFPGVLGKYFFLYEWRIIKELKKIAPDVLITRCKTSWAGIAANYAEYFDSEHVHYIASDNDVSNGSIKTGFRFLNIFEKKVYEKVYNGSTKIICQNSYQKKMLVKHYGCNALLQTQAAPRPTELSFQKNAIITVMWIANLKPLKRPERFLEIVSAFKKELRIKFIMVGPDPPGYYNNLLSKFETQSNFSYLGGLTNDDVNLELERSHILINTSDYEGFSNTFVQAWLRQVIVISMNSNPDGILTKCGVGFLLPRSEDVVDKLEYLINKPNELRNIQEVAQKYSLENHLLGKQHKAIFGS